MSVLEMRQVSRTYGQGAVEVHALDNINLSVDAGTMVAVMGPSGSGKSTLLTIAGSLEDPTTGEVVVAGQDLAGMSRNGKARLRRRSIGFVFQDFNLTSVLAARRPARTMARVTVVAALSGRPAEPKGVHRSREQTIRPPGDGGSFSG